MLEHTQTLGAVAERRITRQRDPLCLLISSPQTTYAR